MDNESQKHKTKHIQATKTCYIEAKNCDHYCNFNNVLWASNTQFLLDHTLHTHDCNIYISHTMKFNK